VKIKTSCLCAKGSSPYLIFELKSSQQSVKTIILTTISENVALIAMDIYLNKSTWTPICTQSTCVAGTNDFSGTDGSTSISFKYLKISWSSNSFLGLCEVWAY